MSGKKNKKRDDSKKVERADNICPICGKKGEARESQAQGKFYRCPSGHHFPRK